MVYLATHTTRYLYDEPVSQCLNEVRLTPRATRGQKLHKFRLDVDPEPAMLETRTDYFGNDVTTFAVLRTHERMTATATSVVEVTAPDWDPREADITWEDTRELLRAHPSDELMAAYEFAFESPFVPSLRPLADYAKLTFRPGRRLTEAAEELSQRVYREFKYSPAATSIDTPLAKVLGNRKGVCQDFAHIMIGSLRAMGLAARYVSGYLRSGANYQGADASHAWVSVFVPGAGWLDFDPTNNVRPTDGHVTLGWGRDYGDITPVKGVSLGGGRQIVEVAVQVKPLEEEPGSGYNSIVK
jgi:transglutaminase-like putative cysteine protease